MKRLLIIILASTLVLFGCQQKSAEPAPTPAIYEGADTVMGRVSYVSGNDLILSLGAYSGGATTQGGGTATPSDNTTTPSDNTTTPSNGTTMPSNGATTLSDGATTPSDGATRQGGGTARQGDGATTQSNGTATQSDVATSQGGERDERGSRSDGEAPNQGEGGAASTQKFVESGEEMSLRIPVGTPILYGSLNVDFSQIQTDYIVSVVYRTAESGGSGSLVLSAEIIST